MAFEVISKEAWDKYVESQQGKLDVPSYEIMSNNFAPIADNYYPCRSTKLSAGYDFRAPFTLKVKAGVKYILGTGIKWNPNNSFIEVESNINIDYKSRLIEKKRYNSTQVYLALYPRSSYGFKYGFALLNTVGIIDADYYSNPDNDGHILVGFTTDVDMTIKKGDKFCQGIITPFMIDNREEAPLSSRTGGTGSTGK
jgi:dUTP pyrophosphatase